MKIGLSLPILISLALGSTCGEGFDSQVAPWQVCDLIEQIEELNGQRVVVQGILSWGPSGYGLTDCRPGHCLHRWKRPMVVGINKAKETSSPSGRADDSFDRMMDALPKQRVNKVIVTFEGTITLQDELANLRFMLFISSVKSMKPFPLEPKLSNFCECQTEGGTGGEQGTVFNRNSVKGVRASKFKKGPESR